VAGGTASPVDGDTPAGRATPPSRAVLAGAVVVVGAVNVGTSSLRDGTTAGVLRLGTAGALVAMARRAGLTWTSLGLGRRTWARGLRDGAVASAVTALAVSAAAATTGRDGPMAATGTTARDRDLARDALVRIPFLVAVPEELIFRSVLLALLLESHSRDGALWGSATAFSLWHLAEASAGPADLARHVEVPAVLAATTAAGWALGWLRLRSGSVLAPVLVHGTLNGTALAAAHLLGRPGRRGRSARPGPRPRGWRRA
jgi:membrane protease YdiL (CAAX protease family)